MVPRICIPPWTSGFTANAQILCKLSVQALEFIVSNRPQVMSEPTSDGNMHVHFFTSACLKRSSKLELCLCIQHKRMTDTPSLQTSFECQLDKHCSWRNQTVSARTVRGRSDRKMLQSPESSGLRKDISRCFERQRRKLTSIIKTGFSKRLVGSVVRSTRNNWLCNPTAACWKHFLLKRQIRAVDVCDAISKKLQIIPMELSRR